MGAFHVADLAQPVRLLGLRYFDGRLENSAERKTMTPEQGATPRTDAALELAHKIISEVTAANVKGLVHPHENNQGGAMFQLACALLTSYHANIGTQADFIVAETALEAAEARAGRLAAVLKESREALQFANDSPNSPISDTIWMMHRPETLFDFMDAALADAPSNWLRDRLREERERCAKACETYGFHLGLHPMIRVSARNCAAAIRALPEE